MATWSRIHPLSRVIKKTILNPCAVLWAVRATRINASLTVFAIVVEIYFATAALIPRGVARCVYRCAPADLVRQDLRREERQVSNLIESTVSPGFLSSIKCLCACWYSRRLISATSRITSELLSNRCSGHGL